MRKQSSILKGVLRIFDLAAERWTHHYHDKNWIILAQRGPGAAAPDGSEFLKYYKKKLCTKMWSDKSSHFWFFHRFSVTFCDKIIFGKISFGLGKGDGTHSVLWVQNWKILLEIAKKYLNALIIRIPLHLAFLTEKLIYGTVEIRSKIVAKLLKI